MVVFVCPFVSLSLYHCEHSTALSNETDWGAGQADTVLAFEEFRRTRPELLRKGNPFSLGQWPRSSLVQPVGRMGVTSEDGRSWHQVTPSDRSP